MKYNLTNKVLTLSFSGRIDSTNANELESEIEALRSANSHDNIVIDADALEYISSAGLRVILRLLKNEPTLKIINVSNDVNEVLEMTGFSEMLPISKGYRHISVEGCEVIGEGANGKVYRTDPDTIVKVYKNPDSLPDIERERSLARRAFVLGVPTAIPFDIVKVGDMYGSVFELLNAKSFLQLIISDPEHIDNYVALSVDLLKKIHHAEVNEGDMPNVKDDFGNVCNFMKAYLSEEKYAKLMKMFNAIKDDHHMLHGDFHMKNVMMQNDEVLLIDMDTLCYGSTIFEFAYMYNTYIGFSAYDQTNSEQFLGIKLETAKHIFYKTVELYFNDKTEEERARLIDKAALLGSLRLVWRFTSRHLDKTKNGKGLVDISLKNANVLLEKVDDLLI